MRTRLNEVFVLKEPVPLVPKADFIVAISARTDQRYCISRRCRALESIDVHYYVSAGSNEFDILTRAIGWLQAYLLHYPRAHDRIPTAEVLGSD